MLPHCLKVGFVNIWLPVWIQAPAGLWYLEQKPRRRPLFLSIIKVIQEIITPCPFPIITGVFTDKLNVLRHNLMGLVLQMMSDCLPICSSVQYCVDLYVSNKEKTTKCKSEPEFIVSLCNFIVPPQTGQTEIGSVRSKEDRECCWRFKS